MRQLFQDLVKGETTFEEIPVPSINNQEILISTSCSLLSSGTERSLVNFSKSSYFQKAKQQPEKVKQVFDKAKNDGLKSAYEAVRSRLDQPLPLGYCNVGKIIEVGSDVKGFEPGDRVVSNGPHAELVAVPKHLCAKIPDNVSDEEAVFTILGSIGLQSVRLINPTFGEKFLVSGLGIIGLLTAQILKANGCDVIGLDPDDNKCEIARNIGIDAFNKLDIKEALDYINQFTNNIGLDGVIIAASTKSNDPIHLACSSCRKRGRIVLLGVTGMQFKRELLYEKELTFQVSCSYGPGRYDPFYEKEGHDYPIAFVRWTQQRNFQSILEAISRGKIRLKDLISKRYDFNDAIKAYDDLYNKPELLGILLKYREEEKDKAKEKYLGLIDEKSKFNNDNISSISVIGCGNYASRILIPNIFNTGIKLDTILANKGLDPVRIGKKFKFKTASTNINHFLENNNSNNIVIATRHDSHALFVEKCLKSGKNVFVEKPLCLTLDELDKIKKVYNKNNILMIGFNRRFAPLIIKLKNFLKGSHSPKSFIYTCNAGYIDKDHWTQNPLIGGGRLIGEACHFVDLLLFLSESRIKIISKVNLTDSKICPDTFSISIAFENGSIGIVNYFSNGNKNFPKEFLEVYDNGRIMKLTNFRKLEIWEKNKTIIKKDFNQDKGNKECINQFVNAVQNGLPSPIPFNDICEVHENLFKIN